MFKIILLASVMSVNAIYAFSSAQYALETFKKTSELTGQIVFIEEKLNKKSLDPKFHPEYESKIEARKQSELKTFQPLQFFLFHSVVTLICLYFLYTTILKLNFWRTGKIK
jgi:hypothetical protein